MKPINKIFNMVINSAHSTNMNFVAEKTTPLRHPLVNRNSLDKQDDSLICAINNISNQFPKSNQNMAKNSLKNILRNSSRVAQRKTVIFSLI